MLASAKKLLDSGMRMDEVQEILELSDEEIKLIAK